MMHQETTSSETPSPAPPTWGQAWGASSIPDMRSPVVTPRTTTSHVGVVASVAVTKQHPATKPCHFLLIPSLPSSSARHGVGWPQLAASRHPGNSSSEGSVPVARLFPQPRTSPPPLSASFSHSYTRPRIYPHINSFPDTSFKGLLMCGHIKVNVMTLYLTTYIFTHKETLSFY